MVAQLHIGSVCESWPQFVCEKLRDHIGYCNEVRGVITQGIVVD